MPRQFPPFRRTPPSSARWLSASVARTRASASRPPSVSPKPPAMRVTVRARRVSTISRTMRSAPRSAATDTTARSAGSGRSASEVNARQPSISSARGWMAQIRSWSIPPPEARFRRMIRPGFTPSAEAPITTALSGERRCRRASTGRAGSSGAGRCNRARPSRATRRPSSDATSGFTSSSLRPSPPDGSKPAQRSARRASARSVSTSRFSGIPAPRLLRSRPVSASRGSVPRSASRAPSAVRPEAASIARARSGRSDARSASVSSPPTPTTTTGPKAGSWRTAARSSRARLGRKRTRSATTAPAMRAEGAAARADSSTTSTADRSAAGSFRQTMTPPTSLLWSRSGEATLTTASSAPRAALRRRRPRLPASPPCGAREPQSPPQRPGRRPRARGGCSDPRPPQRRTPRGRPRCPPLQWSMPRAPQTLP